MEEGRIIKGIEGIRTIERNVLGIHPVGSMVKNEMYGRGVVVGYSSASGYPVVFFYFDEKPRCVDIGHITLD